MIGAMLAVWRVIRDILALSDKVNLGLISAGVAFFGMFSVFPAIAALIAVFGLLADPAIVVEQLELMRDIIPAEAYSLISSQITRLLNAGVDTLGVATAVSLGLALWASRLGVAALMQGLNAISGSPNRSGVRHYLVALTLTVSLIGICVTALLMVVIAPIAIALLPISAATGWILEGVRWTVAFAIVQAALSILYRFGPNRRGDRMRWFTPGALLVVVLWIAASFGFSYYLTNFGSYNEVYGSIGAVIAMLMWLYISAYLILMGAAFNVVILDARHKAVEEAQSIFEADDRPLRGAADVGVEPVGLQ